MKRIYQNLNRRQKAGFLAAGVALLAVGGGVGSLTNHSSLESQLEIEQEKSNSLESQLEIEQEKSNSLESQLEIERTAFKAAKDKLTGLEKEPAQTKESSLDQEPIAIIGEELPAPELINPEAAIVQEPIPQPEIPASSFIAGSCKDLAGQGLGNFYPGDDNYNSSRDRDNDGVACEL